MTDRVFPLIETDIAPVIAELLRGTIARSELVDGGLTNTLRRVELGDGRVLGVKHYVLGRSYAVEGAALREVAGAIPVPEILYTLDRVIVYRWIDGVTLHECRRRSPEALTALAAPLGALLGALARLSRDAPAVDLAPALARLAEGRARARLGDRLADDLGGLLAAQRFDEPACLVHGDLGARNVIVAPALDRIAGLIDWEAATTGSMLHDVGSLLRHPHRHDAAFCAAFERAHGGLPADWLRRARLLDAARLVAILAEDRDLPAVHDELRDVLAELVRSGGAPRPR